MKVEIDVDIPEGYEATGEFRQYISDGRFPDFIDGRVVLRKIQKWRQPVLPADRDKVCRYKTTESSEWELGRIKGWYDDWYVMGSYYGIRCVDCEVEE